MTLPELAIKRPVTTITVITSIVVLGIVALIRLPIGFMPEVDRPVLFVQVPFPNATPEQTERLVVRPIEAALGSVKGVKEMNSRANSDSARVRLEFELSKFSPKRTLTSSKLSWCMSGSLSPSVL